jgi:hypothetical protein
MREQVDALQSSLQQLQKGGSFRGCSYSFILRPPGLLATQAVLTLFAYRTGHRGFYSQAYHGLLPRHVLSILIIRTSQLMIGDFHSIRFQP